MLIFISSMETKYAHISYTRPTSLYLSLTTTTIWVRRSRYSLWMERDHCWFEVFFV